MLDVLFVTGTGPRTRVLFALKEVLFVRIEDAQMALKFRTRVEALVTRSNAAPIRTLVAMGALATAKIPRRIEPLRAAVK